MDMVQKTKVSLYKKTLEVRSVGLSSLYRFYTEPLLKRLTSVMNSFAALIVQSLCMCSRNCAEYIKEISKENRVYLKRLPLILEANHWVWHFSISKNEKRKKLNYDPAPCGICESMALCWVGGRGRGQTVTQFFFLSEVHETERRWTKLGCLFFFFICFCGFCSISCSSRKDPMSSAAGRRTRPS